MSNLRILSEFAVTRTEIGAFRQVKSNTKTANDYCRCLFEQELGTLEFVAAWVCLGKGPVLRLPSGNHATTMVYTPSNRHLRIVVLESLLERLFWQLTPADNTPCPDPTSGELARVQTIDLYFSRLVDTTDVQNTINMMSTVSIRSRLPSMSSTSSQSTEFSPFMSPSGLGLPSPSLSEETMWMSSGESTPNRFYPSFKSYLDSHENYSSDESPREQHSQQPLQQQLQQLQLQQNGVGTVQSPKQGPLLLPSSEVLIVPEFGFWDLPPSPTQTITRRNAPNLTQSVEAARGRTLRSPRHEVHPIAQGRRQQRSFSFQGFGSGSVVAATDTVEQRHRLLYALLHANTTSTPSSLEQGVSASSSPERTGISRRQRCATHNGFLLSATSSTSPSWSACPYKPEVSIPSSVRRRRSCDGRVESRPFSSKVKSMGYSNKNNSGNNLNLNNKIRRSPSKRSLLTISTDVGRRNSLRDTSMSSISVGSSDRRPSISSTMSDVSDISLCLSQTSLDTHNRIHANAASSSNNPGARPVPRKGGPPVHFTLMCWIGGRWPCKLRPLIKKSNLNDIHATLRRNLRMPASYFIDIEFDWEGETYMIMDASHWQWAREQVNFGDMNVRCKIWQKRYSL